MRRAIFIIAILMAKFASSQDLTGIWRGSFNSSDKYFNQLNIEDRYKFEVQIDQRDKAFKGVTYSYKTTVFYGKAAASGTVNPKTGKVLLQELKIVEVKMNQNSYACVMICFLQYSKNGEEEFLEGKYTSYRESDSSFCGRGTVFLRKVTTTDFYKEPFLVQREAEKKKKKQPAIAKKSTPPANAAAKKPLAKTPPAKSGAVPLVKKTNPPARPATKTPQKNTTAKASPRPSKPLEKKDIPGISDTQNVQKYVPSIRNSQHAELPRPLATRENELIKTITLHSNEVTINLYDNGTIDHDTVSVYLDKKLVVSRRMLTTDPITVTFKLDDETASHELVMVAENLGDIPPNTSLMVVKAGDQQYEIRITSTEQKNAVVLFKYEKG